MLNFLQDDLAVRKGPPPALDLKGASGLFNHASKPDVDTPDGEPTMEVDDLDDGAGRSVADDRDVEMGVNVGNDGPEDEEEVPEEGEEEDEDQSNRDEDEDNVGHEAEDEAGEDDKNDVEAEAEADGDDQDEEDETKDEIEHEAAEQEGDADEDEDAGQDVDESDLQPAHRAEALDVLASIELKFALLRERVYVEKMEGLAWEERLVQAGTVNATSGCLADHCDQVCILRWFIFTRSFPEGGTNVWSLQQGNESTKFPMLVESEKQMSIMFGVGGWYGICPLKAP